MGEFWCLICPKARLRDCSYAKSVNLDLQGLPCQSAGRAAVNDRQAIPGEGIQDNDD